jgi:hypothetical protein
VNGCVNGSGVRKKKAKRNESGIETVRLRKVRGSEMSVGHVWEKSRQNMR